jgi:hypothetical protein
MKYDNLNKDNFWNELYEKYPLGMKVFCDWVDGYKKQNDWSNLFNAGYNMAGDWGTEGWGGSTTAPKYHDLPIAFQIGMWIEFVEDRGDCQWEIEDMLDIDWRGEIKGFIIEIDSQEKIKA